MKQEESRKWYPLRVTYSRELKLKARLDMLGIRNYVPMRYRYVIKYGSKKRVLLPAVNNLCFAYATRSDIEGLRLSMAETLPFYFIWDRATSMPITVPEKQMDDFIKVSSAVDEDIVFMTEVSPVLHTGQKVRVKYGPFEGVEGTVVRIKKQRRVIVELTGMMAVATAYVRPEWLNPVDRK